MNELLRIVNGALRLDLDKVRNYTAFLADKFESEGDAAAAKRLRKLLIESENQLHPARSSFAASLPVDGESRFPLVEMVKPSDEGDAAVFLPQDQWDTLNEFLSVAKSYAKIEAAGLSTSMTLLLSGPPGTGKTRLARHISKELGLDLFIARLDGVVSSYLGSTAKNIRALFEFAEKRPCILFLDEFDAIAKLRGDSQELGELKRVVNSFLQNLDSLSSQSIVIAATNHEELLDPAVWRRFGYRLKLDYPVDEIRRDMWISFLAPLEFSSKDLDMLVDLSSGFSGAEIHEAIMRLKRKTISQPTQATISELFKILRNLSVGDVRKKYLATLLGWDDETIARSLREKNEKIYSAAALGELFSVSKATAHRWVSVEATDGGSNE